MPELKRTTTCRGCGKPIAFIKTINGKSIPVDPEPIMYVPEMDYDKFVTLAGIVEQGKATKDISQMEKDNYEFIKHVGYRSHFATCPAADDFRRKKNKSERTKEK